MALGDADADLIVGRRLIDLKATPTPGIVGRFELWQLLGYALADTNDRYGIREVGIAALRWRSGISWSVEELLSDLAPPSPETLVEGKIASFTSRPHDLDQLRAGFAQVVAQGRAIQGRIQEPAAAPWQSFGLTAGSGRIWGKHDERLGKRQQSARGCSRTVWFRGFDSMRGKWSGKSSMARRSGVQALCEQLQNPGDPILALRQPRGGPERGRALLRLARSESAPRVTD